jgi:cell division septum initiation protein DivIVA
MGSLCPTRLSYMSAGQQSDDLAAKAAETVRRVVAEAEDRAAEILREAETKAASIREQAEAEARQIRERGEADARDQIEAAKRALDELGGTLVAAATEAIPKAETPDSEPTPEPEPEPELDPEPLPPAAPEAPVSPPAENGSDAAERLVAMKLAVEGKDRTAIETELADKFGDADRSALLDDVLSRAGG